ncbi:MAG: WXG100 family type VII secretion target [Candidatus Dormibacteraceae bacterium]
MSDGQVKVNFAEIANAAGTISSTATAIDQELDDLHQQIAALQQEWEGGASSEFQAVKTKWEQAARDLQQTLASIGSAVHATHESYLQTEARNSSRWQ